MGGSLACEKAVLERDGYHRRGVCASGRDKRSMILHHRNVADSRLDVPLELAQCHADAFTVRLPHPLTAAHQSRQRNRLGREEDRTQASPVLDGGMSLPILLS